MYTAIIGKHLRYEENKPVYKGFWCVGFARYKQRHKTVFLHKRIKEPGARKYHKILNLSIEKHTKIAECEIYHYFIAEFDNRCIIRASAIGRFTDELLQQNRLPKPTAYFVGYALPCCETLYKVSQKCCLFAL